METKELRTKIITDFGKLIQDDNNIVLLEGVFDAINKRERNYTIPETHYQKVEEGQTAYRSGTDEGLSWEEMEKSLRGKYGI